MSTIVTRAGKGSPLTNAEVDANFNNLNSDKYQEGSAIGAVTPAAGTFTTLTATGQTSLGGAAGSETVRVLTGTNTGKYTVFEANTANNVQLIGAPNSANLGLYSTGGGLVRFYTASALQEQQFVVGRTASAVNYVQVTGAATGSAPTIDAAGSDATLALTLRGKGSNGSVTLGTTFGTNFRAVGYSGATIVNYLQAQGSATGLGLQFSAQGSDTNISQVFQSKGTGAIDLAAGSSGVNISNGGTVTALTRTATGSAYTSVPTPVISAPTTAGGVQATASATMQINSAPVAVGGTGYTVGDILTVVGGTSTGATLQLSVSTVSAGVVTGVSYSAGSAYSALPTNPVSVTGGTGTGATFNLNWGVFGFTITNAGSGYVEQPTVSFSGGGGSGAAAYATVGSVTTVRSLGGSGNAAQSMSFYTPSGETLRLATSTTGASSANFLQVASGSTNNGISLSAVGSDTNIWFLASSKGTGSVALQTGNGTTQALVAHTASAVNYVQVTGAATGAAPIISVQGSDANAELSYRTKGSYNHRFENGSGAINFVVDQTAGSSVVNRNITAGSITGLATRFYAAGSDTNISQVFQSKGTGAIDLAAGSSGVNISNGGTVTAITVTSSGTNYTSIPSCAITAPTTAGGVQATATPVMFSGAATIAGGGTGYAVNDVLTVTGGTYTTQATYTVTAVSGGVITSVSRTTGAGYSVLPSNPVSVTGGTGTGATLNLTWTVGTPTITNAGSGYVEQPTVSFSGGGGSGAAAYATVGGLSLVRGLGGNFSIYTPAGEHTRFVDNGQGNTYWTVYSNPVLLSPNGSSTNIAASLSSKGTSSVNIFTNTGNQLGLAVAHTASAVNYVQVTGAATGGTPTISVQGSDTNAGMLYNAKGYGSHEFRGYNGSNTYLTVGTSQANPVNSLQLAASSSGNAVSIKALGSDTNIDLALTTKGTGSVNLNTGNGVGFKVMDTGSAAVNYLAAINQSAGNGPRLRAEGADTNVNMVLSSKGTGSMFFFTNTEANRQFQISHTASAVNYVQVTGSATGGGVQIIAQGSDANVPITLKAKGSQTVTFGNANIYNALEVEGLSSAVNLIRIQGTAAGTGPKILALGSDTNIDLALTPKGTGALVAQASDGGVTINARGANAVDLQTSRNAASRVASGQYSVVAGGNANTSAGYANVVAGGESNTANAYIATVIGGTGCQTTGSYGFTGGGLGNMAQAAYSAAVGGFLNTATGPFNFIGGGDHNTGTATAAVATQATTTVTSGSTAVTLSAPNAAIKVGQFVSGTGIVGYPTNTYVAAISGTSLTLSQAANASGSPTLLFFTPHGVVVGGGNNQATGAYSFIGGGGDAGTATNRNVASGDWSVVGGGRGNIASGPGAVVCGGGFYNNIVSNAGNTAAGDGAFVGGGFSNQAQSFGSAILAGYQNIANGTYSVILGSAFGITRSIQGNTVSPANSNPLNSGAAGVCQSALLILARQTTDATPTVLASNASAAGTSNQVILPNNSAYYFKGTVVAGVTGAGDTSSWSFEGTIKRGANAASTALVGTPALNLIGQDAGASTWVVALTADTTNGGLAVTVTGQAATTIRWVCKIETTEMTY